VQTGHADFPAGDIPIGFPDHLDNRRIGQVAIGFRIRGDRNGRWIVPQPGIALGCPGHRLVDDVPDVPDARNAREVGVPGKDVEEESPVQRAVPRGTGCKISAADGADGQLEDPSPIQTIEVPFHGSQRTDDNRHLLDRAHTVRFTRFSFRRRRLPSPFGINLSAFRADFEVQDAAGIVDDPAGAGAPVHDRGVGLVAAQDAPQCPVSRVLAIDDALQDQVALETDARFDHGLRGLLRRHEPSLHIRRTASVESVDDALPSERRDLPALLVSEVDGIRVSVQDQ